MGLLELRGDRFDFRLVFTEQGTFLDGHEAVFSREHGTGELFDALGAVLDRHVDQQATEVRS